MHDREGAQENAASEKSEPSVVQHTLNETKPFDPAELLSRLWRQNLPVMRHRVESLQTAADQALAGELPPDLRTQASDIAHKLAGSLGMFGYPAGTDIARQMEAILEDHGTLDPAHFARLTADLRAALPL